jgi:serine/threonine-protein kinase
MLYAQHNLALIAGNRLGPYEILAPIGAGGMGEVYRARDLKLHRDVAIKVLPESVARDPERLARFEREAHLLAALNHPHIAAIYGLEESGGVPALVLELVEGETLAERLTRGPLPVDEALGIARQIGEALETAHEKGIVHRDLKPANVKLTPDGTVKVLDFGLAKAMAGEGLAPDMTHSPTITAAATQAGVVLGTAAYMSPEQARGKPVDKRSDIWSFGAVLYEMLTGRRCFEGETVSDVLAAVLRQEPDWSKLPGETPATAQLLLRRCLERDPKKRLRDVGDAWLEGVADAPGGTSARAARRLPIGWAAAIVLALAAGYGIPRWSAKAAPPNGTATHSIVPLPPGTRLAGWASPVVAISRDGRVIAFVAQKENEIAKLWVHRLDRDETKVVPDSDTAEGPFFSNDGLWIAFATNVSSERAAQAGQLKKYSVSTGLTQPVAAIPDYYGGSFAEDGSILVAVSTTEGLWRLPVGGGNPDTSAEKVVWKGKDVARSLSWPQILPGGRAALVTDVDAVPTAVAVLDLANRRLETLATDVRFCRYAADGRLLLLRPDRTLLAAPFDPASRRITGEPVAVLKEVAAGGNDGGAFAVSDTGTLIYATGYIRDSGLEQMRLVRVSEKGELEPLPFEPDAFGRVPYPSPDGRRLAATTMDGSLWVYDVARRVRSRVPTAGWKLQGLSAVWSPSGEDLVFPASTRDGSGWAIVRSRADGSGLPVPVVPEGEERYPLAWTPDGAQIVYTVLGKEPGLWVGPANGNGPQRKIVDGVVAGADVSPDGKWIVYDLLGREGRDVVAQPLSGPGARIQVTTGGGHTPRWSLDGKAILYSTGDRYLRVRVAAVGEKLEPSIPEELFRSPNLRGFAVAPDGKGFFAVEVPPESGVVRELHLVTNWFSELERLAPSKEVK